MKKVSPSKASFKTKPWTKTRGPIFLLDEEDLDTHEKRQAALTAISLDRNDCLIRLKKIMGFKAPIRDFEWEELEYILKQHEKSIDHLLDLEFKDKDILEVKKEINRSILKGATELIEESKKTDKPITTDERLLMEFDLEFRKRHRDLYYEKDYLYIKGQKLIELPPDKKLKEFDKIIKRMEEIDIEILNTIKNSVSEETAMKIWDSSSKSTADMKALRYIYEQTL